MGDGRTKLSYEDLVLIRELYAIGRSVFSGPPMQIKQIAGKFEVAHQTVYRIVHMTPIEVEWRKKRKAGRV